MAAVSAAVVASAGGLGARQSPGGFGMVGGWAWGGRLVVVVDAVAGAVCSGRLGLYSCLLVVAGGAWGKGVGGGWVVFGDGGRRRGGWPCRLVEEVVVVLVRERARRCALLVGCEGRLVDKVACWFLALGWLGLACCGRPLAFAAAGSCCGRRG